MSKKETTKRAPRKRATSKAAEHADVLTPTQDLVRRARNIIADSKNYDAEARRYIRNSLATSDADDLARDIAFVEAGDMVGDFSSDLDDGPQAPLTIADHLSAVMCDEATSPEIKEAIGTLFCELADDAHSQPTPEFVAALLHYAEPPTIAAHKAKRRAEREAEAGEGGAL